MKWYVSVSYGCEASGPEEALAKTLSGGARAESFNVHPRDDAVPTEAETLGASQTAAPAPTPSPTGEARIRIMKKAEAKLTEAGITAGAAVAQGLVGSGKDGMITQADVDGWLKARAQGSGSQGNGADKQAPIEFSTVRAELGKVVQAHGAERATAMLNKFPFEGNQSNETPAPGEPVQKVSQLVPSQYPRLLEYIAEALAG